jgi:hypothetical protein
MTQPFSLIVTPPLDPVNAAYTQPVDLSDYIDVSPGNGLDPVDPKFTDKVFAHSLLKQGGTLALEDLALKELVFPLVLASRDQLASAELVQLINNAINAPGAVAAWQDTGASQPTYFDLASGQLDIEYDYRRKTGNQVILRAKLRLFSQPLGRQLAFSPLKATGGATVATGTGPLIKFIAGATLMGDGPALIDAVATGASGPLSIGYGNLAAMSVLPDAMFAPQLPVTFTGGSYFAGTASGAVGGTFVGATAGAANALVVGSPFAAAVAGGMTVAPPRYARRYRLLGLARSIVATGTIQMFTQAFGGQFGQVYSVPVGDWAPVDLGLVSIAQGQRLDYASIVPIMTGGNATRSVQLTALYCLPEDTTCVLSPAVAAPAAPQGVSNQIEFDGIFGFGAGRVVDRAVGGDLSSAVRGQVPQAKPESGAPALAFLCIPVGSPTNNPQTLSWTVQVNVLPRTRYIFQ